METTVGKLIERLQVLSNVFGRNTPVYHTTPSGTLSEWPLAVSHDEGRIIIDGLDPKRYDHPTSDA